VPIASEISPSMRAGLPNASAGLNVTAMSEALVKVGLSAGKSVLSFLKTWLDPDMRARLDNEITMHVLSEIPRIMRLLDERIDDVVASGCTPHEANIIAHQVIEAQQRTLDEEKRRRLSNVLVNGLCAKEWSKARHRLMVRLASELEEEHVEVLKQASLFPRRWIAAGTMRRALERELISRGLLEEETKQVRNPKWKAPPAPKLDARGGIVMPRPTREERVPEFIDEISVRRSDLGREFLEHLRDPEAATPSDDE
jgi:hypothetical protein